MKYKEVNNSVREYSAPEAMVLEFACEQVLAESTMVQDYEENISC